PIKTISKCAVVTSTGAGLSVKLPWCAWQRSRPKGRRKGRPLSRPWAGSVPTSSPTPTARTSRTWRWTRRPGVVEVLRLVTVEDVGRAVNPLLVHGQAIGAAVQGLSGTFLEQLVYDEAGQLVTGTFADYAMPTSTAFGRIDAITLEEAPSRLNPLGAKGAGEGG